MAADESFWFQIQQAFTVDRSLVNLNNGGVSPSPAVVQEAMKALPGLFEHGPALLHVADSRTPEEAVRSRLARVFGCETEEIAITRNASEGLQICQFGFDLNAGDEVLTTNQDYPRMITTFQQRARREGIVLKQFSIPVPAEDPMEIVRRFEDNITVHLGFSWVLAKAVPSRWDFRRNGSGVQSLPVLKLKSPQQPNSAGSQSHLWRTVDRNIPCQVASPQSLTPFFRCRSYSESTVSKPNSLDTGAMP